MRYSDTLFEEELKNRVGEDFFADFNHSTIKGRVDFCIADKQTLGDEPTEYLWAEAKRDKATLTTRWYSSSSPSERRSYIPSSHLHPTLEPLMLRASTLFPSTSSMISSR